MSNRSEQITPEKVDKEFEEINYGLIDSGLAIKGQESGKVLDKEIEALSDKEVLDESKHLNRKKLIH